MRVLLVATYELGHQPLNLAAPAAALRARGHDVKALDLSVDPWDPTLDTWADKVACSVPMHTATRMARELAPSISRPLCCYGLYAGMCTEFADAVVAGEYTDALVAWVEGRAIGAAVQLGSARPTHDRVAHDRPAPARDLLPPLNRYTHLVMGHAVGDGLGGAPGEALRLVGSVDASHGCAHRCRHCPVPVVYDGRVRLADEDSVLRDVEQLVASGAQHITFGDPDFLNAPWHSMRVVAAMHERFPALTFDCTVKVEHLVAHHDLLADLGAAGCLFVVSAFESMNDEMLRRLDKGHTAADAAHAVTLLRAHEIDVRPSFLPFTPWTTHDDIAAILDFVAVHDLVPSVDPVQYTIRLLLPRGSLLLEHPDLAAHLGAWNDALLSYDWAAADPAMDELQRALAGLVEASVARGDAMEQTYAAVRDAVGLPPVEIPPSTRSRPHLTESWFCCAEPTDAQLRTVTARSGAAPA